MKKDPINRGLFYVVAGSIQISNFLVNDLKAISKLKDILDEFYSDKVQFALVKNKKYYYNFLYLLDKKLLIVYRKAIFFLNLLI